MEWVDWKFRWLTQEVLNWGGLRFGWTKLGVLKQMLVLFWISWLYLSLQSPAGGIGFYVLLLVAFLLNAFISLLLYVGTKHDKVSAMWELGKIWRYCGILFFIFFVALDFAMLFSGYPIDMLDCVSWIRELDYVFMWYVAACVEPPPKEKKTVRKLAVATN